MVKAGSVHPSRGPEGVKYTLWEPWPSVTSLPPAPRGLRRPWLYCLIIFMPPPVQTGRRHNVLDLFVRSFVRPSVHYQNEHDILKRHEPNLLQIGTSGLCGKDTERQTCGQ